MRWADSDSDDSDGGYNINEEESSDTSKTEEEPIFSDNQQNQATMTNIPTFLKDKNNNDQFQRKHQHHTHRPKTNRKGGSGGNYSGGGNNRFKNPHQSHNNNRGGTGPESWKQLAKASSRFSLGLYLNDCITLHGSSTVSLNAIIFSLTFFMPYPRSNLRFS